jgi:hypothetical protein
MADLTLAAPELWRGGKVIERSGDSEAARQHPCERSAG